MDKMKLKHKEGLLEDLCMLECVINELIKGYNELVEENNKTMEIIRNISMRLDDHIEK